LLPIKFVILNKQISMKNPIYIDQKEILKRYKQPDKHTHKGIQGHALIIGGSYGKIGAVSLSSKACLKTGCGLVTVFIPKCGYTILQTAIPEVMVLTDIQEEIISDITFEITPRAIGIGPGLGQAVETQNALYQFLKTNRIPLVIDADALNIISKNKKLLALLQPKTVITPHPKELERLIGKWDSEEEKMSKTISFSKQYEIIIVMKGAPTHIIDGETVYENTSGNAALATAGTGDVLTGMITSLLAQSYEPTTAAILGVYLHGLTADIALPETGYQSFIASDVIANIGKAFLSLEKLE
jgi:ADP-dependent NAD(P)H-hydrate dehydratase